MSDEVAIYQELQQELDHITASLTHLNSGFAYKTLRSTNDYALLLEKQGAPSGSIILAHEQNAGRGRLNRNWTMLKGDIALSILLRPPQLPINLQILPMLIATATVETLASLGIAARLKWPNDIIVAGRDGKNFDYCGVFRKVGGILVENVFREGSRASVIGIGLNLKPNRKLIETVPHAASLGDHLPAVDRLTCLKHLLFALDQKITTALKPECASTIHSDYLTYCETLGRIISIESPGNIITGRAIAIKHDGSLVIHDGIKEHIIYSGDVQCAR